MASPLATALRALERLAARMGLEVRHEPFDPRALDGRRGGLCRVKGRPIVVMDASLPPVHRAAVLAEALVAVGIEPMFLPEEVRARVRRPLRAKALPRVR